MGKLKIDAKPQRMSGVASQPSQNFSASKLPKLKRNGASLSATKSRSRSGSIEAPNSRVSAALGSFKTPKGLPLSNRTPNSKRQPLSNILHPNSAARPSMGGSVGGKRSSIYGGATTNKDTRPIADKEWQRELVRDLVSFCLANGYHNQGLTPKDFHPINTTTFRWVGCTFVPPAY